ncbi:MAG: apolipoprotein N-acyltransferase [Verrucomicrobia bacterium]|nr:MAG: apolipoprotein N-acyltransferase [Verrucomicrobiota bacterium]
MRILLQCMPWLAALLSGVLAVGLFPPWNLEWLVWICMLPLLWALRAINSKKPKWGGFLLGYSAGAASGLIQFFWLSTVSGLAAVLLPLYLALYWGVFGAFAASCFGCERRSGSAVVASAFSLAAVWAGLECLRGWLFTGFSWNPLGVAFHENVWISQSADLLGVLGLSLFVIFLQVLALEAISRRRWQLVLPAIACVGLLLIYGSWRIRSLEKVPALDLKSMLVQINIPQDAAEVLWPQLEVHQAYEDETIRGLEQAETAPDWVIWPETALTGRLLVTPEGEWATWEIDFETLSRVREKHDFELIYGVHKLEAERQEDGLLMPKIDGRSYNSMAMLSAENRMLTHDKIHLVIFGETIPFVDSLPFLKKIYAQQAGVEYGGSFTAGDSWEPMQTSVRGKKISVIPSICFEDSVARLMRKFVRDEPQVIVNVTNDGWFKESPAAAQHFANTRFRAIELRRPMLRAANTGVSAAIDVLGRTQHPITGKSQKLVDANGSHFTRGTLMTQLPIPLDPIVSLYAIVGDWGIIGLALLGVMMPCMQKTLSRKKRERALIE